MKAIAVGVFSAFAYSYGLWAIARRYGLNSDPDSAGIVKSIAYTLFVSFPIGMLAHAVVVSFRWKILTMIPISLGIALISVAALSVFNSPKGQFINILAFIGMPAAFSFPYALALNRRTASGSRD